MLHTNKKFILIMTVLVTVFESVSNISPQAVPKLGCNNLTVHSTTKNNNIWFTNKFRWSLIKLLIES